LLKILIIEDSKTYAKLIKHHLEKYIIGLDCDTVGSFEELKKSDLNEYDLFIVDMILPDSEEEHIEYLISLKKKIVLITQYKDILFTEKTKYDTSIIEFIIKDDISILNYLKRIVKRFYKNRFLNVLVAEDSLSIRNLEKRYLELFNFNVLTAKNGEEAAEIIENSKIDLLITDLNMPDGSGEDLIKFVRERFVMEELPVMVISSNNEKDKLLEILKLGVNDFLSKPFLKEEFLIRIINIIDVYEMLRSYEDAAFKDALTDIYNRLFLENKLDDVFKQHKQKTIVMVDLDYFKKINDTYGHQIGDEVLKHFSKVLKTNLRKNDIIIRYGGEEFLIYFPHTTKTQGYVIMHKIKNILKESEKPVEYTFSAGIADEGETLPEMIKTADERLYQAKEKRNCMVYK